MQQLFSFQALAAYLGLAEQTIHYCHSTGGDLPKAIKLGHLLPFRFADVDAWLDAERQDSRTQQSDSGQLWTPRRSCSQAEQIVARHAH